MKDRCIIIAGGDADIFALRGFITENDYIIAADSGYRYCNNLEVIPDLLVGDFDSYNDIIPNNIEVHRLPCVKDDTDLLYASRCAVDKKFKNIVIFGGYGSRPDQNLAMLQTLFWIKNNTENTEASAICNGFEICALKNEKATFITNSNRYLSVFTFGAVAKGVSILGADYELKNASLSPDCPLGVSNCAEGSVEISVENGFVCVMFVDKSI